MKKTILPILFIFASLLLGSSAIALLEEAVTIKLRTNENGYLLNLKLQTKKDIKGEVDTDVQLESPAILKLDGRIPVLLIPVQQGNAEVKLNPPTFREAAKETAQIEIGLIVSEIIEEIQVVQKDIQKKNYDKALFKIEELERKYPDVAFLDFIRGSVLFLEGKKSKARQALTRALEAHPNYQEGRDFLKAIGGASTEGPDHE
jgi:tetratricopeptide (TPR) repeat protein